MDVLGVIVEGVKALVGLDVPELDQLVVGASADHAGARTVGGTQCRSAHPVAVAYQGAQELAGRKAP
jgi:hypothetical protein